MTKPEKTHSFSDLYAQLDLDQILSAAEGMREHAKSINWGFIFPRPSRKERHRSLQTKARRMKQTRTYEPAKKDCFEPCESCCPQFEDVELKVTPYD